MPNDDELNECAPKPLYAYIILGVVVVVVLAGAYMNRDAITALVTDTLNTLAPAEHFVLNETPANVLPEPDCADECGRACWLAASGSAEGSYATAKGSIGRLGCDGMCYSIEDALGKKLCCKNSECPSGTACNGGKCL